METYGNIVRMILIDKTSRHEDWSVQEKPVRMEGAKIGSGWAYTCQ